MGNVIYTVDLQTRDNGLETVFRFYDEEDVEIHYAVKDSFIRSYDIIICNFDSFKESAFAGYRFCLNILEEWEL